MQVLNAYVDDIAKGLIPSPAKLEFYVRDTGALVKREAELPGHGSLAPLFYAFGLISVEQLNAADPYVNVLDTNFLGWLQETVLEAVRTAEQHEVLKWRIRKYRDVLQEKFALQSVQVRFRGWFKETICYEASQLLAGLSEATAHVYQESIDVKHALTDTLS